MAPSKKIAEEPQRNPSTAIIVGTPADRVPAAHIQMTTNSVASSPASAIQPARC